MREILLALFLFFGLALGALAVREAGLSELFWTSALLILGGLAFSLPCALRYHQLLYRSLAPRGALEPRWYWNPTRHHARLSVEERAKVLPWFYAGAAGWTLSLLGCLGLGVVTLLWR